MDKERRLLLKLIAMAPLTLLGCSGQPTRRELLLETKKPGEWISKEPYEVVITNGNDSRVGAVNVRSHWDTSQDHKYRDERVIATVKVGASFRSIGQIIGIVGIWGADPAFFVVEKEEFIKLRDSGFIKINPQYTGNPEEDLYYINADYIEIRKHLPSR